MTSKIRELRGESESTVDIPSAQFTETMADAVEGNEVAQFQLGVWLSDSTSKEVKQNTARAYAWFIISARNGYRPAEARVGAGWEPATIARGKDLAVILIERHPNVVP